MANGATSELVILWPTGVREVSAFRLEDLAKGVGLTEQQFMDECSSNDDFLADATRNADPFDREFSPEGGSEDVAFHNLKLRFPNSVVSLQRTHRSMNETQRGYRDRQLEARRLSEATELNTQSTVCPRG